jgi:hypothetical protein
MCQSYGSGRCGLKKTCRKIQLSIDLRQEMFWRGPIDSDLAADQRVVDSVPEAVELTRGIPATRTHRLDLGRCRAKITPRSVEGARTGGSHGVAPVLLKREYPRWLILLNAQRTKRPKGQMQAQCQTSVSCLHTTCYELDYSISFQPARTSEQLRLKIISAERLPLFAFGAALYRHARCVCLILQRFENSVGPMHRLKYAGSNSKV